MLEETRGEAALILEEDTTTRANEGHFGRGKGGGRGNGGEGVRFRVREGGGEAKEARKTGCRRRKKKVQRRRGGGHRHSYGKRRVAVWPLAKLAFYDLAEIIE